MGISETCDIVGMYDPYGSQAASLFENRIRPKSVEELYIYIYIYIYIYTHIYEG